MERFMQYLNDIKNKKSVILTSIDSDGFPRNRAMLVIKREWQPNIMYFSTNTSSNKIQHFKTNPKASIYCYDDSNFEGICLIGNITIHKDQKTKDRFWHKGDEQYYPLGKKDPDYTIIKFATLNGYYYKNVVTKFKLDDLILKNDDFDE